ncbi:DUF1641 domain-containing protein [Alicyclobacillus sp. SO9]|uniref:DUF1641 domain-containing protein n=1 Tax=Alicyclobacillus sp. SO9 TaxID=2665646 RepID=UPI0018E7259D|nr:DUF1641 domain-containing protein [Alicyclobacillus sp. SO9]QQE77594.1 DUF1641 domain-containing protein [Alicyclobacillus sp. SO9]
MTHSYDEVQTDNHSGADPLERLLEVAAGKEKSLERLLNIVEELDKNGFLSTIGYFVNDFEDLVDEGIEKATTPQAFKLLALGPVIKETAGELDITQLPRVVKHMNALMKGMGDENSSIQIHGMLDLLKVLKDPDIRLALSSLFNGLKSLGQSLASDTP